MKMYPVISIILVLFLLVAGCGKEGPTVIVDPPEPTIDTLTTNDGVKYVRTPDLAFDNLPDWPYAPQYLEINGLRQAYAEAGPADGEVVLLLHGQPSWSYLYRKMIPVLADAGFRVIAMDHLGMGRSDKPVDIDDYTYLGHYDRLVQFIEILNLRDINLFVQDWGSLIGLRVAGLNPDWFARIAVGDGFLPVIPAGTQPFPAVENPGEVVDIPSIFANYPPQQFPFYDSCTLIVSGDGNFGDWMTYAMKAESFIPSEVVEALTWFDLPDEAAAAYDAPFPSREYMAGVRKFPSIINDLPGKNDEAWAGLMAFERPFLTIWASNDPGNLGSCEVQQALIDNIPGAEGMPHVRLPESSHFLQDDQGEEIAQRLVDFFSDNTSEEVEVGFEILQIISFSEIIVWANGTMTLEEFESIELPTGWLKNQPREIVMDSGEFARSPSGMADGEFTYEEHFGHTWLHVATITEINAPMDKFGLLSANTITKYHQVTFNEGRTLSVLVSPEGDPYVLISRDFGRLTDEFTIPEDWQLVDYETTEELILQLPNPTINIRTENEDSYQGPVDIEL